MNTYLNNPVAISMYISPDDVKSSRKCTMVTMYSSWPMGQVTLVATVVTNILVPCHVVKSLQLVWKSGAQSSSDLQSFYLTIGYQDSSPKNGHQGDKVPLTCRCISAPENWG